MFRKLTLWLTLLLTLAAVEPINSYLLKPMIHWDEITGEGYVTPPFEAEMRGLRPVILASAERHNRPEHSGMSDVEFAELLATILYNEHNGWFEDLVPQVRKLRPAFQWAQDQANLGVGTNYSLWPSNLRPSVALEILQQRLPVPGPQQEVQVTVSVAGSSVDVHNHHNQGALYAAISAELLRPELAIDYLAANLTRGIERARYEGVAVSWQALAAWHNQGIVRPDEIARSDLARSYILRSAQYRARARALISGKAPLSGR